MVYVNNILRLTEVSCGSRSKLSNPFDSSACREVTSNESDVIPTLQRLLVQSDPASDIFTLLARDPTNQQLFAKNALRVGDN